MVRRRAYCSGAIRRRLERRRRSRSTRGRPLSRRGLDRSDASGQSRGSGPGLARGTNSGRGVWSRARRAVEAARTDDSTFSAVIRILDARRMDRDAVGRAFRDAVHAYRRLRRIDPRRDSNRSGRIAPLARLGRGSQPGPDVHRFRRNSRHHHRGLDAASGSADVSRGRVGAVSKHDQGGRGDPPDFAGRAVSRELPGSRRRRGLQFRRGQRRGGRAGARIRIGRPSAGSVDEARAGVLRGSRRENSGGRREDSHRRRRDARRIGGSVAQRVSERALPDGHGSRDGNGERHVRDRNHVGAISGISSPGDGVRARRNRAGVRQGLRTFIPTGRRRITRFWRRANAAPRSSSGTR